MPSLVGADGFPGVVVPVTLQKLASFVFSIKIGKRRILDTQTQ